VISDIIGWLNFDLPPGYRKNDFICYLLFVLEGRIPLALEIATSREKHFLRLRKFFQDTG